MAKLPFAYLSNRELIVIALLLLLFSTAVAVVLLGPRNRLEGRGNAELPMRSLGPRPILQLELARSERDIVTILSTGDARRNRDDARSGNVIDAVFFVPSYALLLLALGLLGARGVQPNAPGWFWIIAAMVVAAAASDWLENYAIHRTLGHMEGGGPPFPGDASGISTPSLVKWALLAGSVLALGALWVQCRGAWSRVTGIVLLGLGVVVWWQLAMYVRERAGLWPSG